MEERFYYAVVEKEPGSDFGVWFPDFDGCVSAGKTHSEALLQAREALQLHVEGMVEEGLPIPDPTPWDALPVRTNITANGGTLVTMVPVHLKSRTKRINITIDEALLSRINERTDNVSAFLAEAARAKLVG